MFHCSEILNTESNIRRSSRSMANFTIQDKLDPTQVYEYYLSNFNTLAPEQQTHFAWSMYMWDGDRAAFAKLLGLRDYWTAGNDLSHIYQRIDRESESNTHGTDKMVPIHVKYFSRHPGLLAKMWQLIHMLRVSTSYGIDSRSYLLSHASHKEFKITTARLKADWEAIAMLSCGAINYLYLSEYLIFNNRKPLDPWGIIDRCMPYYDLRNSMHLKILSYLYTHLLINETLFFSRPLDSSLLDEYKAIMLLAERLIADHYFEHSLDNKFEFLACAKFIGYDSWLEPIITNEASNSLYRGLPHTYDKLNVNPNKHRPSTANMAHSMAFYCMYNRPPSIGAWQSNR